jgi:PDZ domain
LNVSTLVRIYRDCAAALHFHYRDIEIAQSSFKKIYMKQFRAQVESDGLLVAALSLVDDEYASELVATGSTRALVESLEDALLAQPGPWIDRCSACEKSLLKRPDRTGSHSSRQQIYICACCDRVLCSKECATVPLDTLGCRAFIRRYPPLRNVYCMRVPANVALKPPDFRGDNGRSLAWNMSILHLRRPLKADGSLPKYGMVVKSIQHCTDALDRLLAGTALVCDFVGASDYPVAYPDQLGYVVTEVTPNSIAESAGCRVGDVITTLQPFDIAAANGEDEVKFPPNKSYTLGKHSFDEVMGVLTLRATKLKMGIARPQGLAAQEISEWTRHVAAANEALTGSLQANDNLWFCANCRVETPDEESHPVCDLVSREARHCLSVVRRISRESYARRWIYEDHVPAESILELASGEATEELINEIDESCVSFVRLESMMLWILSRNTTQPCFSARSAFFVGDTRLKWAPECDEASPLKILCSGMSLIARSPLRKSTSDSIGEETIAERKALMSLFLRLACSWCLLPTVSPSQNLPIKVRGPPPYAIASRGISTSAESKSCSKCLVRRRDSSDVCASCLDLQNLPAKDVPTDQFARWYEARSNLVGKSVLLLPTDPIVKDLAKELRQDNIRVMHFDRPVEYLVVSYLPGQVCSDACQPCELEGTFHLVPHISPAQLKFLNKCCKLRNECRDRLITNETLRGWANDGLLDLKGVLKLSYDQLVTRLETTNQMERAITLHVYLQASCSCVDTIKSTLSGSAFTQLLSNCNRKVCAENAALALSLVDQSQSHFYRGYGLVDCLVKSRSLVFETMVDQSVEYASRRRDECQDSIFSQADNFDDLDEHSFLDPMITFPDRKLSPCRVPNDLDVAERSSVGCEQIYCDVPHNTTTSVEGDCGVSPDTLRAKTDSYVDHELTVVLHGSTSEVSEGGSTGWGIELVRWMNDADRVRVYRVVPECAGHRAGLQVNDIVVSLNGKPISEVVESGEVLNAMLSIPLTIRLSSFDEARRLDYQTLGPVVVKVMRKGPKRAAEETHDGLKRKAERLSATQLQRSEYRKGLAPDQKLSAGGTVNCTPTFHPEAGSLSRISGSIPTRRNEETIVATVPNHARGPSMQEPTQRFHHTRPRHVPNSTSTTTAAPAVTVPLPIAPVQRPVAPVRLPHSATVRLPNNATVFTASMAENAIQVIVRRRSPPRHFPRINQRDLYKCGLPGSFLTLVETSLLVKATTRRVPMLGVRMLCPRYNPDVVVSELHVVAWKSQLDHVPEIDDYTFDKFIALDYQRSRTEEGPIVFRDGNFEYGMPSKRFPIDRLMESHFQQMAADANGMASQTVNDGRVDAERIRGGGDNDLLTPREHFLLTTKMPPADDDLEYPTRQSYLGALPDGRRVLWLQSDPRALYLAPVSPASLPGEQQKYQHAVLDGIGKESPLQHLQPNSWWCVWGCGVDDCEPNRQNKFDSLNQLNAHILAEHKYCTGSDGYQFGRVSEGDQICRLLRALTRAACVRDPRLRSLTTSKGSDDVFLDRIVNDGKDEVGTRSKAFELFTLAQSVLLLFDSSGHFRSPSRPESVRECSGTDGKHPRISVHHGVPQCSLCDLGSEAQLEVDDVPTDYPYLGLGCCGYLANCFELEVPSSADVKFRVLRVAKLIPEMLRVSSPCPGAHLGSLLWLDRHYQTWEGFVMQSRTISSLLQAIVILVESIDGSKLPAWWGNGGWHDGQQLMSKTAPALHLHLNVLEAAIAEAASHLLVENISSPSSSTGTGMQEAGVSFDSLVSKTLDAATRAGIPRWDGEYPDEYCAVCLDGGNLLCCELCPNVCHRQCISHGVDKDPEYFVCQACMVDMQALS